MLQNSNYDLVYFLVTVRTMSMLIHPDPLDFTYALTSRRVSDQLSKHVCVTVWWLCDGFIPLILS
jgi:hypothetical protein